MTESTVTLPPVLQGAAIVPSYRVYLFDRANHSRPMKTVEYTGDQEAIQKASQFVDRHDVELWERSRLVMRFPHNPKKKHALKSTELARQTLVSVETGRGESVLRI